MGQFTGDTVLSDNSPDKLDRWRHIRNRSQRLGTRLVVANSVSSVSGFQIVGTPRKQFQAKIRRSWLSTPRAIFSPSLHISQEPAPALVSWNLEQTGIGGE